MRGGREKRVAVTDLAEGREGMLDRLVAAQRGHLFPWAPVALACGIALWFGLPLEPGPLDQALAGGLGAVLVWAALRMDGAARVLATGLGLACAGFVLAGLRAERVDAPVLAFRYYGPVEGRVIEIDRSGSDKVRLTLDRVRLDDVRDAPRRVRLSLHWDGPQAEPRPGVTVATTAHLGPPGGPVEPGGFDFRRMAWFEGLGAVGYARDPLVLMAPAEGVPVARLRHRIAEGLRARLPGEAGAFAAAILVGDRSAIPEETAEALRAANLAHLLAISGLHMGLATGTVFGALRLLIAAVPWLALRVDGRRIAALGGFAAGAGYLLLSGSTVPTERAFAMAAVVLGAVFLGRRALTLRAVAIAALIVLALRPEALTGPGFVLSFAATAALVAAFAEQRGTIRTKGPVARWALALFVSSAVAGAATAPFAAAFFNAWPRWGLPANLLAVPVMGFVVMPSAVASAALAPFGLEEPALAVMGWGIEAILAIARWVAGWPGAVVPVKAPPAAVVPLLGLGLCHLCLWQGRGRAVGAAPMALAALLWWQHPRPDVLVSETGGLVGALSHDGRVLSRERGDGFAAELWLENDGDRVIQAEAAARRWPSLPVAVVHLKGKRASAGWGDACRDGAVLVSDQRLEGAAAGCTLFDARALARTGALAIRFTDQGMEIRTAAELTGRRRWSGAEPPPLSLLAGGLAWTASARITSERVMASR